MNLYLYFDFYGSGNIGDDLMLGGFLSQLPSRYKCVSSTVFKFSSQKRRFPEVTWTRHTNTNSLIGHVDNIGCFVGVGDTPFQTYCWDHFTSRLVKYADFARQRKKANYMVGVGAESSVVKHKVQFKSVIDNIDHIWTRDEFSTNVLTDGLGCSLDKVTTGSDLSHLMFANIFTEKNSCGKRSLVGIGYYSEDGVRDELDSIKAFICQLMEEGRQVCYFANETRKGSSFESSLYKRMFDPVERFRNRKQLKFYRPNYRTSSLEGLVSHYREYDIVFSSRYHGMLAAAWAGCRVVALGRSSKVSALAKELGVIEVNNGYSLESLRRAYETAQRVDRGKLYDLCNKSKEMMAHFTVRTQI